MESNPTTTSSPMRVLTRPPPPSSPSTPSPPPPSGGVVVVGFIGRRHADVSHLINRIIDADIFASGRQDKPFHVPLDGEANDWFKRRKLSYFHDREKGIIFIQLSSSTKCPLNLGFEEQEFGDLQGMLFMFTVCHVIIYVQEGSSFDTQILKILRVLQSAKHALTPFLRSHSVLPAISRPPPSSLSHPPTPLTSSKSPPPRRGGSVSGRNGSTISVMSGLGSYMTLFPGQCTPVTMFAFIDDFSDMVNSSAVAVESADSSSSGQPSVSSLSRSNLATKGSSSVTVLSRPVSKSEGGLRKLQSSLDAQIRFLIKKCRTLSGSESSSHIGSRGGGSSGLAPLLTLDASRAILLLDSSSIQRGKSLDFATALVEEVLNGKATPDSLLLESHNLSGNKEDIMTLKEFVLRQADILRGKGGLVTNANSGSTAGVGMVAVAAAAAAASASSGRATSIPELPSIETWLSSSHTILKGILSAKRGSTDDADITRRKFRQRNGTPPRTEGVSSKSSDPLNNAVSLLECGEGINRRFSALWCQRALPAAMEVYLKDLPPCYPTSHHKVQLEKALRAFYSMVKGPSVQQFMNELEDECLSIWKSGRQLCDAISLTGKPCMHQRHDTENDNVLDARNKEHSSGFVFLHACACGRSRQLRPDPFDFESANIRFNVFPDCDKLLPIFQLPKLSCAGPIQPSSWTVVRLGGGRYYEPSKGLLQPGFSSNSKFLLRWTIVLDKDKQSGVSFADALKQGCLNGNVDTKSEPTVDEDANKNIMKPVHSREVQSGDGRLAKVDNSSKVDQNKISFGRGLQGEMPNAVKSHETELGNSKSEHKQISFGRGLPNITMRKAFAEVVAGTASSSSVFPPLQPKVQSTSTQGKIVQKIAIKAEKTDQNIISCNDAQMPEKSAEISSAGEETSSGMNNTTHVEGNPFLQIGSNVVPLKVDDGKNTCEKNVAEGGGSSKFSPSNRHFVVYIGFEHECPQGHRFILTPEHLKQLGRPYSLPEESHVAHSSRLVDLINNKHNRGPLKSGKNDVHNRVHRSSNGNATIIRKASSPKRPGEVGTDSVRAVGKSHLSKPGGQIPPDSSKPAHSEADFLQSQPSLNFDDNGPAFSLLNRNLPIYMNCPHCKAYKDKKYRQNFKFAGFLSQLQRIFVVTPPYPIVLATNPIVQFERSCQPTDVLNQEQQLQFSLGCQVILPPESFVSIRLPFVYGIDVKDKGSYPLNPFEHQPELTAWIMQGTALQAFCQETCPA